MRSHAVIERASRGTYSSPYCGSPMRTLLIVTLAGAALFCCAAQTAFAVPSFARQTGFECTACHVSWPELTSVGRQFKLGGFTLTRETKEERPWLPTHNDGPPPRLPLAAMVQASFSDTRNTSNVDESNFPRNDAAVLQQLSLLYAGRIVNRLGAFAQWTYDGVEHHSAIDNVDIRFAGELAGNGVDLDYGVTLNNNPTVSDIYNTTPAWSFPFASSSVAIAPNAATLIDGGLAQQVAGLGAYAMWNRTLYTEAAAYRTADRAFSIFRAGVDKSTAAVLDGAAPYWRLALQHVWAEGKHSAMIGTYGIVARKFPDSLDPAGPTDRYRDVAIDAQYQYVADRHRFSTQLNWIDEHQKLDATFAENGASNAADRLRSFKAKATYYFDQKYGVTLQYFRTSGSADDLLYNTGEPITGSASGSPNSSGVIAEVDWLPARNLRLLLQFTAYREFNGGRDNYDGHGRNAKDNDTLYFVVWLML